MEGETVQRRHVGKMAADVPEEDLNCQIFCLRLELPPRLCPPIALESVSEQAEDGSAAEEAAVRPPR